MSRFVVDSTSLMAVRDELGLLHEQLLTMHNVIWGYWGSLGGRELEGELEHFCGTWHYGVTEIAGEVTGMMTRLEDAATAYERIERRVAESGSSGGVSPAPPAGSGHSGATAGHPGQPARSGHVTHSGHATHPAHAAHPSHATPSRTTVTAGSGGAALTGSG